MGFDTSDDACVYKVRDDLAIIQTVDFFPPVVDDPYQYGQIAAANALSDVYAMGGTPSFALNILCFPSCLPLSMLKEIMAGGQDKVREAGAVIAGGHSIDDPVPKYGLCVSGFIHPDAIWTNHGAREGDLLILTKPLGSGINNTAAKCELLTEAQLQPTIDMMATLNKYARDIAVTAAIHACTDITGFGLLGHAREMADGSGKTIQLFGEAIPLLPHALSMAEAGAVPGGAYRNSEYAGDHVSFDADISPAMRDILFDPQTSGGLLFSVPEDSAEALLQRLRGACKEAAIVGRVLARCGQSVRVTAKSDA